MQHAKRGQLDIFEVRRHNLQKEIELLVKKAAKLPEPERSRFGNTLSLVREQFDKVGDSEKRLADAIALFEAAKRGYGNFGKPAFPAPGPLGPDGTAKE